MKKYKTGKVAEQELNDALEMIGIPVVQFERPSVQLIDTGKGAFKTVTTAGWIKFGIAFRNVMHQLKGAKLAVFMSICLHVNEEGEAWPSMRTIAAETGFDKGTVSASISELESIPGLMTVIRREGTSNLYRPSFAVYGKHVHTPPENAYTPPLKMRTEVEPSSRANEEEKPMAGRTPAASHVLRPRDLLFDAIADVCKVDPRTAGSSIGKVKSVLSKAGYTPEDVSRFGEWWWGDEWRKTKGAPPSLWTLQEKIGIVKSGTASRPTAKIPVNQRKTGGWISTPANSTVNK